MIYATMMFPMAAILGIGFLVASEAATRPSEAPIKIGLKRNGVAPDLSAYWGDRSEDSGARADCNLSGYADKGIQTELSARTAFPAGLITG